MSTHSMIYCRVGDKLIGVYCHYDGYTTGVGQVLKEFYNSQEAAEEIVALGDLSYLEKELDPPQAEADLHSFDHPVKGVTVAYHRDRGEDFRQSIINIPAGDIENIDWRISVDMEEYNYMFIDGEWQLFDRDDMGRLEFEMY